jgi:hypothetical protein
LIEAEPHARARRLARVICSDIVLYHFEAVAEAAHSEDPRRALEHVWQESTRFYEETIAAEIRDRTNYLDEAFDALVEQMRIELGGLR